MTVPLSPGRHCSARCSSRGRLKNAASQARQCWTCSRPLSSSILLISSAACSTFLLVETSDANTISEARAGGILCVHVLLTEISAPFSAFMSCSRRMLSAGNDIRESHGSQCACRESAPFARRVDFMWSESLVDVSDGRAIAQRLSWLQRCVV